MLSDNYSRTFKYLRLSVTESCNFRCSYCLPDGYKPCGRKTNLSPTEIQRLVRGFNALGVEKVRLTGGEPTLRNDLLEVVAAIKEVDPAIQVAMTTNGHRLRALLPDLRKAGLDAINISLDSLNPETFKTICGRDQGIAVRDSVDQALAVGIKRVKVNAVLLKGVNDHEIGDFIRWVRDRRVSVRFIELMRTTDNAEYFARHHLSAAKLKEALRARGWRASERNGTDGPAVEFEHKLFSGRIGFISPYQRDFCETCNRLRVSALGKLRLCLFGDGDHDLRRFLQADERKSDLMREIVSVLRLKPASHRLHENITGSMNSLSAIGG